jgi:hypothetical protein
MRTVIGLTGYAGSGKDTAAEALIQERGFVKIAFADPLREAMGKLNPIVGREFKGFGVIEDITYNQAIYKYGYTDAKGKFPELRRLLQVFGTEVGREMFGEDFWIQQFENKVQFVLQKQDVVITDVRFPNEVEAVRRLGGIVARIHRPGFDAVNGHVSDTGVADLSVDIVIHNDSTIEDLRKAALNLFEIKITKPSPFVFDPNPDLSNTAVQPSLFEEDNSWAV